MNVTKHAFLFLYLTIFPEYQWYSAGLPPTLKKKVPRLFPDIFQNFPDIFFINNWLIYFYLYNFVYGDSLMKISTSLFLLFWTLFDVHDQMKHKKKGVPYVIWYPRNA